MVSTNALLVAMGVSGSGKSVVGAALAQRLRIPFADADDFHPPANIAKMTAGEALDDHDRFPWLEAIGVWLHEHDGGGGVISCSALKRKYRDQLRHHAPRVEFVHLDGDREVIERRQSSRAGHFMPSSLLSSQFQILERLAPDEHGFVIDVDQSIDAIVQEYIDLVSRALTKEKPMPLILPFAGTGTDLIDPVASDGRLLSAALLGIAAIVVLITWAKLHPFLALTVGGLTVGIVAGVDLAVAIASFTTGFGSTAAGVGTLIALGAMFGKLLADSGGADQIVDTIVGRASTRTLPWAMAGVGALIGLPMFFEIGLVLLMPVIYLVARRTQLSLVTVGIPALAGLSAMHGLVPPHPGPLTAIDYLDADLGITLALGVAVAIPTIVLAGPVFAKYAGRWVDVPAPHRFEGHAEEGAPRPSFPVTMLSVLLPVVLMMGKALADIFIDDEKNAARVVLDTLGTPLIALLIAVVVAMFTLGRGAGMGRTEVAKSVESSLPAIAGILLIVAAGGGFKQSLVDTGVGTLVAEWVADSNFSVLLLAWFVAVLIRLATGSATVATVTTAGLLAPLTETLSSGETSLMVLAIGAGSVFFSHVNDAGFWLVKEYFGLSVGQTIKSWSLMETLLSVSGLVFVLALGLVI